MCQCLAILAAFLLANPSRVAAGQLAQNEYRLKANFLAMSPSFVEWPVDAVTSSRGTFALCVYGDFFFGTTLAEMARASKVQGRRIEVKWIKKEGDLRACNLLFVSRSEQKHYESVTQAVRGTSILTIGETPEFLDAGGMVSLVMEGSKLQFDVNLGAAERAHLKMSSRLLALARHVIGTAQAEKS